MTDRSKLINILFYALLVFGLLYRVHATFNLKQGLSYDESISYLCSAATQSNYANEILNLKEARLTIGDIQNYYATPELQFRKVALDMSTLDRHPPLYWWSLHFVHHYLGFNQYNGLLLTIAASLLILLLLYQLSVRIFKDKILALLVCTLYYLSPAVVQMDLEARNYPFMALFALASTVISFDLIRGRASIWRYSAFIIVNALGFLSHYYYGFLLVPGLIFHLVRNGLGRSVLIYSASLFLSLIIFFLVYPGIFDFIGVYSAEPEALESRTLFVKIRVFIYGWMMYFTHWHWAKHLAFWICAGILTYATIKAKFRSSIRKAFSALDERSFQLWFLTWCMGFTTLFYLLEISPAPATGEQYFAYFWPQFTLFLVVLIKGIFKPVIAKTIFCIYLAQLTVAFVFSVNTSYYLKNALPLDWYARMNASEALITNETGRSNLPRYSVHLKPELTLFIDWNIGHAIRNLENDNFCILVKTFNDEPAFDMSALPENEFTHWTGSYRHHELHHYQRKEYDSK